MTVREPLPAPDRSRRPGPKGKGGQEARSAPRTLGRGPSPSGCAFWRGGEALPAPAGEDVQRGVGGAGGAVREPSHLGMRWPAGPGRPPSLRPPFRDPPCARRGGRVPRTAVPSHPGPGAGGAGEGWCGRVFTRGRAGGRRGGAGHGRFSPGSDEDLPGLRCWPGGG